MDTRALGRVVLVGVVVAVIAVGIALAAAPAIADRLGVFDAYSDDHCGRQATGEPNRDDPDCQADPWSGINHVEEWDRAHPSP